MVHKKRNRVPKSTNRCSDTEHGPNAARENCRIGLWTPPRSPLLLQGSIEQEVLHRKDPSPEILPVSFDSTPDIESSSQHPAHSLRTEQSGCSTVSPGQHGESITHTRVAYTPQRLIVRDERICSKQKKRRWIGQEIDALYIVRTSNPTRTWKDIAKFMNKLFEKAIKDKEIVKFRDLTLKAQFSNLLRGKNRGDRAIWNPVIEDVSNSHDQLIVKIRCLAEEIGFQVCSSLTASARTSRGRGTPSLGAVRATTAFTENNEAMFIVEDERVKREADELLALFTLSSLSPPIMDRVVPRISVGNSRLGRPGLLYRIQSSASGGVSLMDGSVQARKFGFDQQIQDPPPSDSSAFLVEAAAHLQQWKAYNNLTPCEGKTGNMYVPTSFISTTESFIDVYTRGLNLRDPNAEILVMSAKDLHQTTNCFEARTLIKKLHTRKPIEAMNVSKSYRGRFETLVWGKIPSEVILHRITLGQIENLANQPDGSVSKLLRFDVNLTGSSHKITVSEALGKYRKHFLLLDCHVARGLGKLARLFGLRAVANTNPDKEMVKDLIEHGVYDLLDGFVISVDKRSCSREVLQAFILGFGYDHSHVREGFLLAVKAASKH